MSSHHYLVIGSKEETITSTSGQRIQHSLVTFTSLPPPWQRLTEDSRSYFGDNAMACCPSVIGPQFIIIGHDKPAKDMLTRVSTPVACVGQGDGISSTVDGVQYGYSYARYNLTRLASNFLFLYPYNKGVSSPWSAFKRTNPTDRRSRHRLCSSSRLSVRQ